MRTLSATFFALLLAILLPAEPAQAKKFGGGFTLGKTYTAPKRVAPAPTATATKNQTAQPTAAANTTTARPRSGFGGMMAGLLAGGLLGALFFGGAFNGVQPIDLMLLGLAGLLIYKFFFARANRPAYAESGAGYTNMDSAAGAHARAAEPAIPAPPEFGGAINAGLAEPQLELPGWFNKQAFVEQASRHFTRQQRAWDEQDWQEIRSYTSDELFEALRRERARLPAEQHTEVESVMAELINFIDEGEQVVVSIHFYGWMREDEENGTTEFSEIWHLSRDMQTENADWFIVGIEQPS